MKQDFLSVSDLSTNEVWSLFELAKELKAKYKRGEAHQYLKDQTLGLIFLKPSTRTRISFEVGMFQLGGHALYLPADEIGLEKREAFSDVARVISSYVDGIMARMYGHQDIIELAHYASVPVINGLTDLLHPCQIIGDMFTIWEDRRTIEDLIVAYIGDGNNVANSWVTMATRLPFTFRIACPEGYEPSGEVLAEARTAGVGRVEILREPAEAARGAHVIYTDVWASMGQEGEVEARKRIFRNYVVDAKLMSLAAKEARFMHCLPAHRGEEVTHEVIESPTSIIFTQAENRMHAQKALLVMLMGNR
ncbi:MAG: ornithine carbamoyltransferase [bacterium]